MTDYECTLLVGIPNALSVYSLDVNPDLAHQRQEKVVDCIFMKKQALIVTSAAGGGMKSTVKMLHNILTHRMSGKN